MTTVKDFLLGAKDAKNEVVPLSSVEETQTTTDEVSDETSDETQVTFTEHKPGKLRRVLKYITKRNVLAASLIAVIGLAVYINWAFEPNYDLDAYDAMTGDYAAPEAGAGDKILGDTLLVNGSSEVIADEDSFFAMSIVDRQIAREQAVETLRSVVYNAESMPDVKNNALEGISAIAKEAEAEASIQTLIKGKGFAECVAVVNGENANVIVKASGLMPNEIAQIKEIVYEQAGVMPENIKIIEKS